MQTQPSLFNNIPLVYQKDKTIIETALKQDWTVYFQLSSQQQNNQEYCLSCVSHYILIKNAKNYFFIPKTLKYNNEFLEKCIELMEYPKILHNFFQYLSKIFNYLQVSIFCTPL
jgi:hypothetical protein